MKAAAVRYPRRSGRTYYGEGKFTSEERQAMLQPARDAVRQFATGVAMLPHWHALFRCLAMAQAIEQHGIVRGAGGHLHAAAQALQAIHQRSCSEMSVAYVIPHLDEQRLLEDAIDIHELQLQTIKAERYRTLSFCAPAPFAADPVPRERTAHQEALAL